MSPASERGNRSVKRGRSRLCGCGVDIQTQTKLAESIMRPRSQYRRRQSQGWWQQQQQPRQYDVTDDDNLPELSISSSPRRKCCRTLVVREETCANSQCIMCRRRRSEATEVSNVGGVDYAAAESISRPKQNWRSQLCGRGVNIAESIVALAWLAESILGDVITLKF